MSWIQKLYETYEQSADAPQFVNADPHCCPFVMSPRMRKLKLYLMIKEIFWRDVHRSLKRVMAKKQSFHVPKILVEGQEVSRLIILSATSFNMWLVTIWTLAGM